MKRVLRILFNIATLASLALCIGVCAVWVRSYRVADEVTFATPADAWYRHYRTTQLLTSRGGARLSIAEVELAGRGRVRVAPLPLNHRELRPDPIKPHNEHPWTRIGFDRYWVRTFEVVGGPRSPEFWHAPDATLGRSQDVSMVPLWSFAIPLALLPAARLVGTSRRWWRRRRIARGLCPHCAYNLSGNTTGVCPECGTHVSPDAVKLAPCPASSSSSS